MIPTTNVKPPALVLTKAGIWFFCQKDGVFCIYGVPDTDIAMGGYERQHNGSHTFTGDIEIMETLEQFDIWATHWNIESGLMRERVELFRKELEDANV